ncbi:hypothetical protein IWX48DRAFT_456445 [Phyllosticta citricarpa]
MVLRRPAASSCFCAPPYIPISCLPACFSCPKFPLLLPLLLLLLLLLPLLLLLLLPLLWRLAGLPFCLPPALSTPERETDIQTDRHTESGGYIGSRKAVNRIKTFCPRFLLGFCVCCDL